MPMVRVSNGGTDYHFIPTGTIASNGSKVIDLSAYSFSFVMLGRSTAPEHPETTSFVSGPFIISLDGGQTADFATLVNPTGSNTGLWLQLGSNKQLTVGWRYDYSALPDGILVVVE